MPAQDVERSGGVDGDAVKFIIEYELAAAAPARD